MSNNIIINKGSDMSAYVIWPDTETTPLNLTGWTVDVYDAQEALVGHMTATVTDATAGRIDLAMNWQEDMPMGTTMSFRLRLTSGDTNLTSPRVYIEVR